jgi:glutamate-1-semialdehyde 2,1-aminomutase
LEICDPSRPGAIPHYGTFNGNPATMAGGVAALELLTPEEYDRINGLGDRLRRGIDGLGAELGLSVSATGLGSLLNVHLLEGPIRSYRDVARADQKSAALLHLACLNEGLFLARRGLMCTSTPMDDSTVDEVLQRLRAAVLALHLERPLPARSPRTSAEPALQLARP